LKDTKGDLSQIFAGFVNEYIGNSETDDDRDILEA
jgi:hypothetical protein